MFVIPQGGYNQHGVANTGPNFGTDVEYFANGGVRRGDYFEMPGRAGATPYAAASQPKQQTATAQKPPDMSVYSAGRAQPVQAWAGTPYAPSVTQSSWQTPPMTFGGGGLGNYANMAPDMRPPGFEASFQDPFGGMSSQPNYAQRDAFIQQLNDRTGQYQQGMMQGAPSFDFGSMWSNAGQMAQDGFQNPFVSRELPSVTQPPRPAKPPRPSAIQARVTPNYSRAGRNAQYRQARSSAAPARSAASQDSAARRQQFEQRLEARRQQRGAGSDRAQAINEIRQQYPGISQQMAGRVYNLGNRQARLGQQADIDSLISRLSPPRKQNWRQQQGNTSREEMMARKMPQYRLG